MLIKKSADIRSSEITDRKSYLNRREFLRTTAGVAVAGAGVIAGSQELFAAGQVAPHGRKLEGVKMSPLSLTLEQEKPNSWEQITTYNNYYEFGTDKGVLVIAADNDSLPGIRAGDVITNVAGETVNRPEDALRALRDQGATPEEAKAIATTLGARGRDGGLKEGQKLRILMAPAGTPEHIVQKVNTDLRTVVAMPDVVERFQTLGTYTRDLTPEQTGEFMRSEERLWWPIVRQVNQRPAAPAR